MALNARKTEMHGDTSRWDRRAVAKYAADRIRRRIDRQAVVRGLAEAQFDRSTTFRLRLSGR